MKTRIACKRYGEKMTPFPVATTFPLVIPAQAGIQ
jgi:hypothetical protein